MPKEYQLTEEMWNARLKNPFLQKNNPKTLSWDERKARIDLLKKSRYRK
ncbi:hypothetical protein [Rossellomorea vietnamensis]|nr:hypothetical protein [Rossellomorea vietnamensis]